MLCIKFSKGRSEKSKRMACHCHRPGKMMNIFQFPVYFVLDYMTTSCVSFSAIVCCPQINQRSYWFTICITKVYRLRVNQLAVRLCHLIEISSNTKKKRTKRYVGFNSSCKTKKDISQKKAISDLLKKESLP